MTRLWTSSDQRSDRAVPARRRPFGGAPLNGSSTIRSRYPVSGVRPTSTLIARGGLLAVVAIGFLGGVVGLLRSPGNGGSETPPPTGDAELLPGSVAGVAERAVEAWLTAASDDDGGLDALFVEAPAPVRTGRGEAPLTVDRVTAIAGERLEDGHWTVIVAAEVVDPPPEAGPGEAAQPGQAAAEADSTGSDVAAASGEAAAGRSTWYVEIGIVGNDAAGPAALATPGVLPGPLDLEAGWRRDGPVPSEPRPDDPLAAMVDSFLNALLAGQGDPAPYLASGVDIPSASPPPFAGLTVDGLSVVELDGGDLRVWVEATAVTPSGSRVPVAYEITVAPRADRFDVLELWGSPTVTGAPSPPDDEGDGVGDGGGSGDPTPTSATDPTTTLASGPGA